MLVDWLPAWLLWLLPVPLATTAAIAWASWSSRARGPVEAAESVRQHERFRAALAGTQAPPTGTPPATTPGTTLGTTPRRTPSTAPDRPVDRLPEHTATSPPPR